MAKIEDVIAYLFSQIGPMSRGRLAALCYYIKAWHLVWDEEEIFLDFFEATASGVMTPYIKESFSLGEKITHVEGDPSALTEDHKESILGVIKGYGKFNTHELSDLIRSEAPWKNAWELVDANRSEYVGKDIPSYEMWAFYAEQGAQEVRPLVTVQMRLDAMRAQCKRYLDMPEVPGDSVNQTAAAMLRDILRKVAQDIWDAGENPHA